MATMRANKKLKQGRREAERRGRATKDSPEMAALRKKKDSRKTGIRKTRKRRDIANKRSEVRSTTKHPRRKKHAPSPKNPRMSPGGEEYLPGDPRRGPTV